LTSIGAAPAGTGTSQVGSLTITHEDQRIVLQPGQAATIGRHAESDVVIAHEDVSEGHLLISSGPESWVLDNTGATGTYVDGLLVTHLPLLHIVEVHLGRPDGPVVRFSPAFANPYKGLTHFTEEDSAFFFGRERERDLIISSLKARRLTVLYGQSGVGKSSLMRAGVTARLRRMSQESLEAVGTPEFIPIVFSQWRDDPLASLMQTIREAALQYGAPPVEAQDSLVATIEATSRQVNAALLIILDQFEEYFLYHGREAGDGTFFSEFPQLANQAALPVGMLVSIREDALAQLDRFKVQIPSLFDSLWRVHALDATSARQAISCPIDEYNRRRTDDQSVTIEPDLIDAVLDQIRAGQVSLEQAGAGTLGSAPTDAYEAPYLQLVMSRLWDHELNAGSQRLRLSSLQELGGAQQIVRTHLDSTLDELEIKDREIAADVFKQLVTPSGTKIALSAVDLGDLIDLPDDAGSIEQILETLQPPRIVRHVPPPPGVEGPPRYEIFHDVLAPAILDWRSREFRARAERDKLAAERLARSERRKARLWRAVALVLIVAVVGALLVDLHKQSNVSKSRQLAANAENVLPNDPELATNLALQAVQTSATPEAQNALRQSVGQVQQLAHFQASRPVKGVAYSSDGRDIAAMTDIELNNGNYKATTDVWDLSDPTARPLVLTTPDTYQDALSFSADGKWLVIVGNSGEATLFAVNSGSIDPRGTSIDINNDGKDQNNPVEINGVAFAPDSQSFAAADNNGNLCEYSVNGTKIDCTTLKNSYFNTVAYNSTGTELVTATGDEGAVIWESQGLGMITTLGTGLDLYNTKDAVFNPAPGSTEVATALVGGTAKLWLTTSPPELVHSLETVSATSSVAFNQSGTELVTTNQTGQTTVWDSATGAEVTPLNCFCGSIGSAAFDPKASRMVTGGENGAVDIWDTTPRNLARQDPIFNSQAIDAGQFLPGSNGRDVVVVDLVAGFAYVEVWNLATDRRLAVFEGNSFAVNESDPDNLVVINNSVAQSVSISGKFKPRDVFTSSHSVSQIAISSKAQWLGSIETDSNGDSYAYLYNIKTKNVVKLSCPQTCAGAEAQAVRFDKSQKRLLVRYDNGALLLWSTDQPHAQPCELFSPDPGFTVSDAEFDTNGNLVVTADSDGNATIFSTASCATSHKGSVEKTLNRVTGSIYTAQFNPASTEIVTAGLDGSLTLWNVASGQPIVLGPSPDPTPSAIEGATFDVSGAKVLSVGNDGVMRLWSATVASESLSQLEKTARARILEDLTPFQQSLYSAAAK